LFDRWFGVWLAVVLLALVALLVYEAWLSTHP
jgi:uncharacterized membrane protein YjgN (DUF898 family)